MPKRFGIRLQNSEHTKFATARHREQYARDLLNWCQTAAHHRKPHILVDCLTVELPNVDRLWHADGVAEVAQCAALIHALRAHDAYIRTQQPGWRSISIIPKSRAHTIAAQTKAVLRMEPGDLYEVTWPVWLRECNARGFDGRVEWGKKMRAYAEDRLNATGRTFIPYAPAIRNDSAGRYCVANGVVTRPHLYPRVAQWLTQFCRALGLSEWYLDWKHHDIELDGSAVSWPPDHYSRPIPIPVGFAGEESYAWRDSVTVAANAGLRVVTQFYNPPTTQRAADVLEYMDDFALIRTDHPQP